MTLRGCGAGGVQRTRTWREAEEKVTCSGMLLVNVRDLVGLLPAAEAVENSENIWHREFYEALG